MATEYVESVTREAPEIEARKLALMQQAQDLYKTPLTLPAYQAAGLAPTTTQAIDLATQGVGAYQPYVQAAGSGIAQGQNLAQAGARGIASINVAPEFAQAQQAQQQGLAMAEQLPAYAQSAGLGYGSVAQGMQNLQGTIGQAGQYSQANLAPSQAMLGQAAQQTMAAQPQYGQATSTIQGGLTAGQQAVGMAAQAPGMAGFGQGIGSGYQAALQAQQAAQQPGFAQATSTLGQAQQAAGRAGVTDFGRSTAILGGAQGTAEQATRMAQQAATQPGFQQGIGTMFAAAEQARQASQQPGFNLGQGALAQGIGTVMGGAQGYQPGMTQEFMSPYQQQVIDESIRQINRQGDIAQQGLAAQAVRTGAFGGTREGVQRAELERALSEQRNAAILGGLQQG